MVNEIYVKIVVQNIDLLTKFVEAYDNLGIVSTIDSSQGIVVIRCTNDTYNELIDILNNLPFTVQII